jgi:hypothetical protein
MTASRRRSTPTHYDAPLRNPAKGSVFAYYFAGLAIADAEPKIEPWLGPFEIGDDTGKLAADYLRRTNPEALAFQRALAEPFVATLRRAGVDPTSPLWQEPIEMYVTSQRALFAARFGAPAMPAEERSLDDVGYRSELGARVVWATSNMLGRPGQKTVYSHLNEGAQTEGGLTRHHIDSAKNTMVRWANGPHRRQRQWLILRALDDQDKVQALEYCRRQAKADGRFVRLRGAELAEAIHDRGDLNEAIYRAKNILLRKAAA